MEERSSLDGIIRTELDEVVGFHADDVGEEVTTGQCQVFDHKVEGFVGVLNPRNGYVANLDQQVYTNANIRMRARCLPRR